MPTLSDFIPEPRLCERDEIATPATADRALELARHFDLARSPIVHALFWLRTLPERLKTSHASAPDLRIDAIGRTGDGFMVLEDSRDRLVVGAIGRFWENDIAFADVAPEQFAAFAEPGWGKVVWQLSAEPTPNGSRLCIDLSVTATDDASWQRFQRYFRWVGPFSRFIRQHELRLIARELGGEIDSDSRRPLPGDARIPNPKVSATDSITIEAAPEVVWPWLVQMGCGRGGWYSYDWLDNGGVPSAMTVREDLQGLRVGDVLPATPDDPSGFTVLELDAPHALVVGGLFDPARDRSLPIDGPKPEHYSQVSWAFFLERLAGDRTRLLVRVRADYAPDRLGTRLRMRALSFIHHAMERAQLTNLKARAEGRAAPPLFARADIVEGAVGAAAIVYDLATPFRRRARCHWGLTEEEAAREYPGDSLVPEPRWQWTHAIDVPAPPSAVWPWIAQLGQDKAGFYSYRALENLAGCEIHDADRIHPEWQDPQPGDALRLHPKMPPLVVHEVVPERHLVVCAGLDPKTGVAPRPTDDTRFVAVTWVFQLEPLSGDRTRLVSRYRCACSGDWATRIAYGPYIAEAVGFVMDRRMLIGIAERAARGTGEAGHPPSPARASPA